MLEDERESLKREVIEEALEYDSNEEIKCFFSDLFQHGCVSGMVGKLVWYSDTHTFYDKHYDEIEDLRVECLESVGEALNVGDRDWKNTLAWFGFEETAYQLANELGLEVKPLAFFGGLQFSLNFEIKI
tara:strand:- start:2778 stop:3164 length:387 start_codon:yes stop_codon:yes gene_type:complete